MPLSCYLYGTGSLLCFCYAVFRCTLYDYLCIPCYSTHTGFLRLLISAASVSPVLFYTVFQSWFLVLSHPLGSALPLCPRVLWPRLPSRHSLLLPPKEVAWTSPGKNSIFQSTPVISTYGDPSGYWSFVFFCILILTYGLLDDFCASGRIFAIPSFSLTLTSCALGFTNSCHQRPSSGFSPYRYCPCRAHKKRAAAQNLELLRVFPFTGTQTIAFYPKLFKTV